MDLKAGDLIDSGELLGLVVSVHDKHPKYSGAVHRKINKWYRIFWHDLDGRVHTHSDIAMRGCKLLSKNCAKKYLT